MNLEEYVKKYEPKVFSHYQLKKKGWDSLKIGMHVKTLVPGYSGPAGVIREISEFCSSNDAAGDYLILIVIDKPGHEGILYRKDGWWKKIELCEEN